jgi:hypothetical protein
MILVNYVGLFYGLILVVFLPIDFGMPLDYFPYCRIWVLLCSSQMVVILLVIFVECFLLMAE